ncbi:MAG: antibiotic biosynthesis monooxygenase [Pseudonocardia sp.]|nr:antibiotic biosynthesis monooxygenase [Pseudonocardia sp.]
MLLVCRFQPLDAAAFAERAQRALALLTKVRGCLGGELGRAVDEPAHWVLTVRFASVDAYRRALRPFDVREHVVPLLSEAVAESATFETLASAVEGQVSVRPSLRSDG